MSRFQVWVVTKAKIPYIIEAESPQDAIERVLAGEGETGDVDYPEPDIFAKELER